MNFVRELKKVLARFALRKTFLLIQLMCVSQFGSIQDGKLIQAKGHNYTAQELLGGDANWQQNLQMVTLLPFIFRRVIITESICHATQLCVVIYVPGDLFSVNPLTAENVPNLFSRNERVVCIFDTGWVLSLKY